MSRSSTQPASEEGKQSLFESMMSHSEHPWHILPSGIWSQHTVEPTRERLIESEMAIGLQTRRKEDGKFVFDVHYPTRAEAEATVDLWLSRNRPEEYKRAG